MNASLLETAEVGRWALVAWCQFWQVTVLVAVVGLLARLIGDRPRLLRCLWLLVLVKCLVPPLWSSPVGLFCWAQTATEPGRVVNAITDPFQLHLPNTPVERWLPWLALLWLAGVAVIGIRWLRARRRLQQLVRAAKTSRRVQELATEVRHELGLKAPVRIAVTDAPLGPAVGGIWRPYVLLPRQIVEGMSESDVRILLSHELLHVRRGDLWVSLLQSLVAALWWFHPAVRWALRRLDDATERCVDQEVIGQLGVPPRQYAGSLLSVLELRSGVQAVWGLPGVRRAALTHDRMCALLRERQEKSARSHLGIVTLILGAVVFLPGRVQPTTEPPVPECCRVDRAPTATGNDTNSKGNVSSPTQLMQQ